MTGPYPTCCAHRCVCARMWLCPVGSVSRYSPSMNNKGMRVKVLPPWVTQELAWVVTQPVFPGGHSISQSGTVSSWLKRAMPHSIVCFLHVSSPFAVILGVVRFVWAKLCFAPPVSMIALPTRIWVGPNSLRGGSSYLPCILHLFSLFCCLFMDGGASPFTTETEPSFWVVIAGGLLVPPDGQHVIPW